MGRLLASGPWAGCSPRALWAGCSPPALRAGSGLGPCPPPMARPAERRAHGVAVHAWQVAVEDDHVIGRHEGLLDSRGAVIGHVRADSLIAQAVGDVIGQFGLIFDHEYAHDPIVQQRGSQRHHMTGPAAPGPAWLTCAVSRQGRLDGPWRVTPV